MRPDEEREMAIVEEAGVTRGTPEWNAYLSRYRGSFIHAWIGLGLSADEFRLFNARWLRRVVRLTNR